jgi:ABC-type transporter Mla subunit MlaD
VKAYFTNASGLRDGANVRVAGVDVGSVKSVRVRPELKEEPVEVVMVLNPRYEVSVLVQPEMEKQRSPLV